MFKLAFTDAVVIVCYFLVVFAIAWWASTKTRSSPDSANYFLAGRNAGWFVIGASLFASNIGSEHLIGLAGTGASSGIAVSQFEILAGFILLLLGWVFVPFYLRSGVYTMPEFLELRYSKGARTYLTIISIIAYVLTKISVTIKAGGIVFEALGINFWIGAVAIVVITGLYTILGGLRAVIYTDMIQMIVLIGGALTVTLFGLSAIDGWEALMTKTETGFMEIWKPVSHPDFPWTGIIFGAPILGVWYWCTDQFIVQRVLSANGIDQARRGTIFGGFLKMTPLFIFVIPGVIAYVMSQEGTLQLPAGETDQALPLLMQSLLPVGLRGLVVAGLLAALMSSLSSVFNSCSTLITWDLYKKLHPRASERRLVWVGKIATAVLVLLGIAWIPLIDDISEQLFTYLQSVQGYISPPIAAVFLLGIFSKRLNGQGAMAALLSGFVLGALRLIAELNADALSGWMHTFATVNFLHFAVFLFIFCTAVLIIVSLLTAKPEVAKVRELVYEPRNFKLVKLVRKPEFWWSIGLLAIIAFIWIYFA